LIFTQRPLILRKIKSRMEELMKASLILTSVLTILVFSGAAYSQGGCNHLTNPTAKRNCLVRQLNEATRQQKYYEERLNSANRRMQKACSTVEALDQAARIASNQGSNVNVKAAGVTWRSLRAIMSALTRERRNCESARQEVARAGGSR
jgi:hypothetical protein